jgi:uncharacterized protein YecT (DUF1311 family)
MLIAVLLAANLPIRAQHMNEKDSPCANVVMTVDLANCLANARDAADAKLNAVYKQLRGKLDAADGQRLVAAQRLWIQYRDANRSAERDLY